MEDMEDDSILQFCGITNTGHDTAVSFLEMANGNVGQAITLYLETRDLEAPAHNVRGNTREGAADSDISNIDTDVEIARQLAQEDKSRIRPPIAPIRDILVGGDRTDIDLGTRRTGVTRPPPHRRIQNFANLEGEFNSNTAPNDRLNELYNPPFEIMCPDNFERARTRARNEHKWLMVDIQNNNVLSSLALNRDLWSDKTVRDVIREHFLFLQVNSQNGRHYISFYPVDNYPHIAIIDPRTGERLKVWSSEITPTDFLMAESGSVFDSILPVERDPVQGPNTTVIKFRLADGETTLRRFGKSDPVRHLFEFIKSSVPKAEKQPFELVCYSDNLIEKVNMSIEDAGLANVVVNIIFG
ncbi:1811_t:CDS:10 [Diversispora eburnea]|uniref:1811_t:CDS:1 n=1 Tax=Diversispora eburnea TaxID=1213867 RepID=A0A9N9BUS3_9GLOM|nr:1811_t:CDS:10 [Diversispora eburnea]